MRGSWRLTMVACTLALAGSLALAQQEAPPPAEGRPGAEATAPAPAQPAGTAPGNRALGILALCFGAALTVLSGSLGIAHISARATDSIARQPEASGSIFLAWLLPAAMIEGAMLFGMLICYMAMDLLR